MRKHEFPFARVLVFVPFADRDGRLHNPYYDYPGFREDVSGWFEPLSLPHQWVAVTASGLPEAIEAAADAHAAGGAVIVNLCDGSPGEEYPGLEVVEALEAAALPYTGADPAFYRITSSKIAMKKRFRDAGLPTASWQVIHEAERDLWAAGQTLDYPLILKLDGASGSLGLSAASIVRDHAAALSQFAALGKELPMKHGPVLAEPFLPGREFATFFRYEEPARVVALASCERVYNADATAHLLFGALDQARYAPVEASLDAKLQRLALSAFAAVGGVGYGRIDTRQDRDGGVMLLEVNANCGLSDDIGGSTVGCILQLCDSCMAEQMRAILTHGWRRWQEHGGRTAAGRRTLAAMVRS